MAIKTFTTGEVLTAADTNTYLANSGLVYIKQVNLTGTTVNITSCFSSSFDAYQIVITNGRCAGALVATSQMLNGSTPDSNVYQSQRMSLAGTIFANGSATGTAGYCATFGSDYATGYVIYVYNPFQAQRTSLRGDGVYTANTGTCTLETLGFLHSQATSYDGISLIATSSSWLSGKAVVYGIRQS